MSPLYADRVTKALEQKESGFAASRGKNNAVKKQLQNLLTTMEAMCAGIGSPGTLQEILRGYFGDKKAPERFRDDDIVKAGFITIVSQSLVLFIMLSLPYVVFNKLNNDSASSR
mgnify:CR=1 FL=1